MIRPALWQAASVPGTPWQASKRSWAWVEEAVRWLCNPCVLCLWTSLWLLGTLLEVPAAQISIREWISPLVSQLIIYFQPCHLIIYFHSSQSDACETSRVTPLLCRCILRREQTLKLPRHAPPQSLCTICSLSPYALPPDTQWLALSLHSYLMEYHLIIREVLSLSPILSSPHRSFFFEIISSLMTSSKNNIKSIFFWTVWE